MSSEGLLPVVKETIRTSIRRNTHHGFIGWSSCDNICMDLHGCLDRCEALQNEGQPLEALEVMVCIFVEGIRLASCADSSSGMLTDVLTRTCELTGGCTKELAGQEKQVRDKALAVILKGAKKKAFDGWPDSRYDLLRCGICLCDEKSAGKLEGVLDVLLEKAKESAFPEFERKEDQILRYLLHRHLCGREAAQARLYEHLDIAELCRIAVRDALEDGDYGEAERLCLEKAQAEDAWHYQSSDPDDWNHLLFEIYQSQGAVEKQSRLAKKLLLYGNESFWDILKQLYKERGIWEENYEGILAELKDSGRTACYRSVLISENEMKRLLDDLTENPDGLFLYGSYLAGDYAEQLYGLCEQAIRDSCAQAHTRREYKRVAKQLRQLIEWGGRDAAFCLIDELARTYPRRTALLDELRKVRDGR